MKLDSNGFYACFFLILSLVLLALVDIEVTRGNLPCVWFGSVGIFLFSFLSGLATKAWAREVSSLAKEASTPQSEDR